MSPAGKPPRRSADRTGTPSISGRYAAGQVLAMVIVLLIGLPLLPLILLIVVWIRLRDRTPARAERTDAEPLPAQSRSPVHVS